MSNNVNISKKNGTRQTFAVTSEESKTLINIFNVEPKLGGAPVY